MLSSDKFQVASACLIFNPPRDSFSTMIMKAVSSEGTGQWEMGGLQRNMGAIFKGIKGDKRLNWQR